MRLVAALICMWFGGALLAPPAHAHAVLTATEPSDRQALLSPPAAIVLKFNEHVKAVYVRLLDANGVVVAGPSAGSIDNDVRLPLATPLPNGAYVVSFRVISDDAHPVGGAVLFAVGPAPATWVAAVPAEAGHGWQIATATNRAAHYIALGLVAGASLFLALGKESDALYRRRLGVIAGTSVVVILITAGLAVGLEGGLVLQSPVRELFAAAPWSEGQETTQLRQSLAAAAVALLLAASTGLSGRAKRVLALAGAVAAPATIALTGHVVTSGPVWIAAPMLFAHALPAMVWFGSLAPLMAATALPVAAAARPLSAFSRWAVAGAAVAVVAGGAVALEQVRTIEGLLSTDYGQVLLLKVALVAAAGGLATWNRLRLTPRALRGEGSARAALYRTIGVELLIGITVLATTGALAGMVPPRSLAVGAHDHDGAESAPGYVVGAVSAGKSATIALEPARAGRNTLTIHLAGAGWAGVEPRSVSVTLDNIQAAIEGLARPLRKVAPSVYQLDGPEFAVPGDWTVRVLVLVTEFDAVTYTIPIPVAP